MGISSLFKVIKEHAPEQIVLYKLEELRGIRVAVDVSIFLYKSVMVAGNESNDWLNNFIRVFCTLKKYDIDVVCIFDGPNAPEEKLIERKHRREQMQKSKNKLSDIIELRETIADNLSNYRFDGLPNGIINQLAIYGIEQTNEVDKILDRMTKEITKLSNQTTGIDDTIVNQAKELMDILGIYYFTSDGEAEKLCCYFCNNHYVDAVLTDDSDVLAYGVKFFLTFKELSKTGDEIYGIHSDRLYKSMGLTYNEFRDLCILLRCDYNRHCDPSNLGHSSYTILGYPPIDDDGKKRKKPQKAVSIGPKKAWDFIQRDRSLDVISNHLVNPEGLKYERCREIFSFTEKYMRDEKLYRNIEMESNHFQVIVDERRLRSFIDKHNIYLSINTILEAFNSGASPIDQSNHKNDDLSVSSSYDISSDTD